MFQSLVESIFEWLHTWSGVVGTLGSLILSACLVILYNQQRKILREQQNLTESEQKAVLRLENYSFVRGSDAVPILEDYGADLGESREFFGHMDFLYLYISNFGKSAAQELRPVIEFEDVGTESGGYFLIKSALSNSIFVNPQMAFNQETGVVGPNERMVPLSAQIGESNIHSLPSEWVPEDEEIEHAVALSEIMYLAGQRGVTELEITFSLEYHDATGEREPIEVVSMRVNPLEYDSFGRALQEGEPILPK